MHSRISFLHVQYHGRSIIIYMCVRLLGFMLCRFWKSTHKVFMILVSVMSSKTLLHTTFLCNGVCQNFDMGMCFNMGLPFFAGTFLFFSSLLLLWFQQLSMITQWTLILGTLNILFFLSIGSLSVLSTVLTLSLQDTYKVEKLMMGI
jgi:hypothetical protein